MQNETAAPAERAPRTGAGTPLQRLPVSMAFLKFVFVGAIAFLINQAFLFLFYDVLPALPAKDTELDLLFVTHPDVRLLVASVVSVELAIIFKFFAHEHWTFPDRRPAGWAPVRLLNFNLSCILATVITIATVNVLTPVFGISPYITNTVGVLTGFMANWVTSAYLIWPTRRPHPVGAE
jgi:putative flippase GtrA